MKLQLMQGKFNSRDALELITNMVHIKIKYHENKIAKTTSEEDIKSRESKIKQLQKELFELRETIITNNGNLTIEGTINIE